MQPRKIQRAEETTKRLGTNTTEPFALVRTKLENKEKWRREPR
jgi:hypothetical protein